jgi:hypothetical protein
MAGVVGRPFSCLSSFTSSPVVGSLAERAPPLFLETMTSLKLVHFSVSGQQCCVFAGSQEA